MRRFFKLFLLLLFILLLLLFIISKLRSHYDDSKGTIVDIINDTDKTVNAFLDKYKPPCLPISDGDKYTCNPADANLECNSFPYNKIKGYKNATKECTWKNNDAIMTIVDKYGNERNAVGQNWQTLKSGERWRIRLPLSNNNHPYWCSDTSEPDLKAGKRNTRVCAGVGGWFTPENVFLMEPKGVHRHEFNVNAIDEFDFVDGTKSDNPSSGQFYYNLSAVDGINSEMDISYAKCDKDSCSNVEKFSLENCPKINQAMIYLSEPYNSKNNAIYTCLSPCGIYDVLNNPNTGTFIHEDMDRSNYNNEDVCAKSGAESDKTEYHKKWDSILWDKDNKKYVKNPNQENWSKEWSNYINAGVEDVTNFTDEVIKQIYKDSCLSYSWSFDEQIGNTDGSLPRASNPFKPLKTCDFKEGNVLEIRTTKVLDGIATPSANPLSEAPPNPFYS